MLFGSWGHCGWVPSLFACYDIGQNAMGLRMCSKPGAQPLPRCTSTHHGMPAWAAHPYDMSEGAFCSALADRKIQLVARQDPTEHFCLDCIDVKPYHMAHYDTAMLCR